MVPRSAKECRVVLGRGGKTFGRATEDGLWCRGVPRSAEWCREGVGQTLGRATEDGLWCRGVPRSAEWCREGVGQTLRTVCGAEECQGVPSGAGKGWEDIWESNRARFVVPRSAEECRVVLGRGGADIEDGLWCRGVPRSAEWCREGVGQTLESL